MPDLIHIVMFYNEGVVFQTTFDQPINIPEVGMNLVEILNHLKKLFELIQFQTDPYKKLIYETANFIVIILKLGENSNIALFFKKGESPPQISSIQWYLYRIEELIDTDKIELEKNRLGLKKKELNALKTASKANLREIELRKQELANLELKIKELEEKISKKKTELQHEDIIQEKFEQIIEQTKEVIEDVETKEIKKTLQEELKDDKKDLKTIGKTLSKEEKQIGKMENQIKDIETKKESIFSEIGAILEKNKVIQEKISERSTEINKLDKKIRQLENEKFKRKFIKD